MKRTLLPALLGFKLKLSTLMPLLLAGFFFMASKAVFFSKLAILIGASIALKSLLFSGAGGGLAAGGGHLGAYGLHPVGHSGDNFWDHFLGSGGVGHHNPYGPVSFKSAERAAPPPEVLDPANDNIPRTLEGRASEAKHVQPLVVLPAAAGQRTNAGKRNFAWDTSELKKNVS